MSAKRHVLAVPVDHALAFTADRGWHVITAPPARWLEERELELVDAEVRLCGPKLTLVPPPVTEAEAFEQQGCPGQSEAWPAARRLIAPQRAGGE